MPEGESQIPESERNFTAPAETTESVAPKEEPIVKKIFKDRIEAIKRDTDAAKKEFGAVGDEPIFRAWMRKKFGWPERPKDEENGRDSKREV